MTIMGLLDNLPFISSLYGSDKNASVKRSWSRISHTHSDVVPLNPHTSTTEDTPALPQALDLELANRLLTRASQRHQKIADRENKNDLSEPPQEKDENTIPEDPQLSKRTTATSKRSKAADSGYEELDPTSPVRSNDSKNSKRSRTLEGLKKLLSRRKSQEHQPVAEIPDVSVRLEDNTEDEDYDRRSKSSQSYMNSDDPQMKENKELQDLGKNIQLDELSEPRKVSDQTVLSLESDKTTVTVCRRPSKHASSPIATVDRNYMYQNPFEDVREASDSQAESNPFTDQPTTSNHSVRLSSSAYSDSDDQQVHYTEPLSVTPKQPIIYRRSSKKPSASREDLPQRSLADNNHQLRQFGQRRAAIEFNKIAVKLNLQPLSLSRHNRFLSGKSTRNLEIVGKIANEI